MIKQSSTKPLCAICKKREFKYTCPRCNIQYCSKECYKSTEHSACSELFFRDWFVQEMKERKVDPAEQERIMAMLQKVEEENPIEDFLKHECDEPLEERLRDLNIESLDDGNTEKLWDLLTQEEREQFDIAVKSGQLFETAGESLNQTWEPWWCKRESLVQDITNPSLSKSANIPKIINFPELSKLLPKGKEPSPLVAFNLLNTLYPFVLFQRIYNGFGVSDFATSFVDNCTESSMYLHKNQTFDDAEKALVDAMNASADTCKRECIEVNQETLTEAVKDVGQMLTGPSLSKKHVYVCSALSELHTACGACRKTMKSDGTQEEKRKHLFVVMKKLQFLVSWCSESSACFPVLAIETLEIYKKKKADLNTHIEINKSIVTSATNPAQTKETESIRKPLIEEI